jgi:cell division protein FtsW (lipid II flippase)
VRSARLRELVNLVIVGVLTAVGFASVYTARENQISSTSLVYAGFFLVLFAVAHIGVRAGMPNADPWLLPLAALLCALGLTEIYRLQPTLARDQSVWIVIGLIGFLGLVFVLRDHRRLETYKYSLATVAVGLLLFTMVAGTTVNGARLWIRVGGIQVQPGEFVKLLLVISVAGYLRANREVLTFARRRVLGVDIPAARHLGPLALMAAASLGVLAVMNDLGSALLLFGIFLAMIYVATGRHLYTVLGLGVFAVGSLFVYKTVPHVHERFSIWIDPWSHAHSTGYQVVQSVESIADGGVFGTGLGRSLQVIGHGQTIIPAVQTDGIYAAWSDETGLAGAAGLLLIYLLFAYRGFKIATLADDSFSKLLACGLTFSFTLQAFLIVGGITRLIPLTGVTLPFVSYGGSSIVSNFLMLALLLMISDRAAARRTA